MKQRNLLGLLLMFVMLTTACAQNNQQTNSLLWKVSGNGLESPSYLFGTHHLIPLSFLDNVPGVNEAFDATEQVVGELDMSKMAEMQAQIMMGSVMPQDYSYNNLLSEDDYALLDNALKENIGMGLDQLGQMKPAMLNNLLVVMEYQKLYPEMNNKVSIDQYFQDEATKKSLPVIALETAEDQIYALLGHQSIERQAEMLACLLNHPELLKEQMDRMQEAYLAQDLKALAELYEEEKTDDPCPSTQEEKDVLNKDRNLKWLDKLPEMMSDRSSFVAVGCLHLVGKDGLIEGLRQKGYTVEAVK